MCSFKLSQKRETKDALRQMPAPFTAGQAPAHTFSGKPDCNFWNYINSDLWKWIDPQTKVLDLCNCFNFKRHCQDLTCFFKCLKLSIYKKKKKPTLYKLLGIHKNGLNECLFLQLENLNVVARKLFGLKVQLDLFMNKIISQAYLYYLKIDQASSAS